MTALTFLSKFLQANLLIALGATVALSFSAVNGKRRGLSFRSELGLHYGLIAWLLATFFISAWLPRSQPWLPKAQVWAAATSTDWTGEKVPTANQLVVSVDEHASWRAPNEAPRLIFGLIAAVLIWGLLMLLRDSWRMFVLRQNSVSIRHIGRLRILAVGGGGSPFSFSDLFGSWIVLPETILSDHALRRVSLLHEFQHLRHHDTVAVYGLAFLRWVFFLNPFFAIWHRRILELQEFACDETLVDQRGVSAKAMGGCLLRVAELSVPGIHSPVCATGMCFSGRSSLKRRIIKMSKIDKRQFNRLGLWFGSALALVLGGATAWASQELVQDRRITLEEAQGLKRFSESDFPLAINELVVKELNVYVGTPDGRKFVRESLIRMRTFKKPVLDKMETYSAPMDLLAVPLVESGFQNLTQENNPVKGAGLWQFIPTTARNYGLKVNPQEDQRLDVELETDAAMRYLLSNRLRFKSWELALLAYNSGEGAVQKAIDKFKTRDAWELARKGAEVYPRYLAKVVAVALILRNQNLVD